MMDILSVKTYVLATVGVAGGFLANQLGGWDLALQVLILFMAVDYITGLMVAGVFKQSKKSENGALESRAGWKGLCRKFGTLLIVLVSFKLDQIAGTEIVRYGVIIAYIVNETISIIENMGLMGVYIPDPLAKAIDALANKEGD